jgi:hypothetical protein
MSGGARKFFGSGAEAEKDWKKLRGRWERSHVYRAIAAAAAFLLLSVAIVK